MEIGSQLKKCKTSILKSFLLVKHSYLQCVDCSRVEKKKPKSKKVSLSRHILHLKPTRYMKEILSVAN